MLKRPEAVTLRKGDLAHLATLKESRAWQLIVGRLAEIEYDSVMRLLTGFPRQSDEEFQRAMVRVVRIVEQLPDTLKAEYQQMVKAKPHTDEDGE